jgi:dolichol kinase
VSEPGRRLVHASGAVLPLAYAGGVLGWPAVRGLLLVGAAAALCLEAVRLRIGLDWAVFDRLTREYERDNPAGYALYFVSSAAVAVAFAPPIAAAGILMLAIGDPISGVLADRNVGAGEGKAPAVLAAMFGVCFGLALPLTLRLAPPALAAGAAAAGALGATLADGLTPVVAGYVVDDNLSIPPTACLAIGGVLRLAPG